MPGPASISEQIVARYEGLTHNQQRLADFLLHNLHEVAMMSSAALAQRLKVSEATVVRFSQELGFSGYPKLRSKLQEELLSQVRSSDRVAAMVKERAPQGGTLHEIAVATANHLQLLTENVSEADLENAVSRINGAKRLFIFGEGAPGSLTYHADFWFSRLGCQVQRVTETGRRFFDRIFQAGEGDVGLIMAFRRPSPEAMALLELLKRKQGQTILVTDLVTSKMHPLASQVLTVTRGPMNLFRPLGAVTAMIDALILGLMRLKGDQAVALIEELDDLRQRHDQL